MQRRTLLAIATTSALGAGQAQAQGPAPSEWPDRPVRVIVPFPPGSTPDTAARAVAAHLTQAFGRAFVCENRSGAGGNIGTEAVAKATDGHTIGVSINGPLTTAPVLYPALGYAPARDLAPLSLLARMAQFLVVHPAVPATNLGEFLAHARANPDRLAFGSVGNGSAGHLAMEDLMARTGTRLIHAPYRGFPPAVLDLVAGRLQAMLVSAAAILPQLQAGQVRGLAVSAAARLRQAPEVPTLAEAGLPEAESYAWIGLIAPAGLPEDRLARLSAGAQAALAVPATRAALENAGFEVVGSDAAGFTRFLAAETERWGGLARRLGLRAED
jgi:tripartite-type tricarboxylate transporter receptor subunit TctC